MRIVEFSQLGTYLWERLKINDCDRIDIRAFPTLIYLGLGSKTFPHYFDRQRKALEARAFFAKMLIFALWVACRGSKR